MTIATYSRQRLFGEVAEGAMILNDAGRFVSDCWLAIPDHFPAVRLDAWIVMPDHVHGIIIIDDARSPMQDMRLQPLGDGNDPGQCKRDYCVSIHDRPSGTARTLGSIVRGFKIGVTKWYRAQSVHSQIWQRNYWDRIIRNDTEMDRIRRYIDDNPKRWSRRIARRGE